MHAGRIFFLDDEEEDYYEYITNEVYILKEKMEPLQHTQINEMINNESRGGRCRNKDTDGNREEERRMKP